MRGLHAFIPHPPPPPPPPLIDMGFHFCYEGWYSSAPG